MDVKMHSCMHTDMKTWLVIHPHKSEASFVEITMSVCNAPCTVYDVLPCMSAMLNGLICIYDSLKARAYHRRRVSKLLQRAFSYHDAWRRVPLLPSEFSQVRNEEGDWNAHWIRLPLFSLPDTANRNLSYIDWVLLLTSELSLLKNLVSKLRIASQCKVWFEV